MVQPHLTPLEKIVMGLYKENEYLDDPGDPIWVSSLSDHAQEKGIKPNQFSGVVSSLVKKGQMATDGERIWSLR